jgi:hypothetical protein
VLELGWVLALELTARALDQATPSGAPFSVGAEGGSGGWEQLEAVIGSRRWRRRLGVAGKQERQRCYPGVG